jgi:3,4-dihydroxy-2-butanone 4-phosphate synthase
MTATEQDNSLHMKERLHIVKEPVKRTSAFAQIEHAIAAIRVGQMVIVVDDEGRENEGDLTIAAEKITPQAINFMAQHGRGLICLAMTPERLDALEIPLMVQQNSSRFETAFASASKRRRVQPREFLPPIVLRRCLRRLIRRRSLRISFVLATCSHCAPGVLECWPEPDKRKRP